MQSMHFPVFARFENRMKKKTIRITSFISVLVIFFSFVLCKLIITLNLLVHEISLAWLKLNRFASKKVIIFLSPPNTLRFVDDRFNFVIFFYFVSFIFNETKCSLMYFVCQLIGKGVTLQNKKKKNCFMNSKTSSKIPLRM